MSQSGEKGTLNRGAIADLWRNTVSQIPSVFGRLFYFASLRNQNTGYYEHHGMAARFGERESHRALAESHAETFAQWLSLGLEQQKGDLDGYLEGLEDDKRTVVANWLRLKPYGALVPATAREVEKRLYLVDFEVLLELLKSEYGVVCPDPDA